MLGRRCQREQHQIKTLGTESLMSISGEHFTGVTTTARGSKHVLCNPTQRGLWEAYIWLPPDFAPCTFSFCWFCYFPFAVINFSHEYKHMLSPMNFLANHWTWGWFWKPNTYLSMLSSSSYDFAFYIQVFNPVGIFLTHRGMWEILSFVIFSYLFHSKVKHLEKCTKYIGSLVNYYKTSK